MTTEPLALWVALVTSAAVALVIGWKVGASTVGRQARSAFHSLQNQLVLANAELAAATRVLDGVMDTVPIAILVVDGNQLLLRANTVAVRWFDLAPPGGALSLLAATRSAELHDLVTDPELTERTVRVRSRTMNAQASRLDDGSIVLALRDDTRLEHLERARRDLVANVSHDLRTPLTSLGLLAETLADRPPDDPDRVKAVATQMQGQVTILRLLADGLIELSRLEEGRAVLRMSPQSLLTMLEEAAAGLAPQARERDVTLNIDVASDLTVLADRSALGRGLSNLLDNAIRYSPRGGTVTIAAVAEPPEEVVVRVTDQGPGIPSSERERVFERFYRGDRSRGSEGAGLGLAVVRHVVRGHGGEATVEATQGPGTTIRITLLQPPNSPGT